MLHFILNTFSYKTYSLLNTVIAIVLSYTSV